MNGASTTGRGVAQGVRVLVQIMLRFLLRVLGFQLVGAFLEPAQWLQHVFRLGITVAATRVT
jgi:hypothetical protein